MSKANDFETPPGRPYEGPSGIARDSVWLTNEDVPHDRDTVLTIERVNRRDNVKFQGGRTKPVVLSLEFKETKRRELGLNATNRKTLTRLFGSSRCADWVGKRIALFVQPDVSSPQGLVPAIRIRAKLPPQDAKPEAPEAAEAPDDDAAETEARRQEQA